MLALCTNTIFDFLTCNGLMLMLLSRFCNGDDLSVGSTDSNVFNGVISITLSTRLILYSPDMPEPPVDPSLRIRCVT